MKHAVVRIELILRIMGSVLLVAAFFAFRLMPADFRGDRLLEAAASNHDTEVKLFLWLGADVNYSSGNGTALHQAAFHGNVGLVSYLLEHGALVDAPAKSGVTPLWQARERGQPAVEQVLLAHGANPNTSQMLGR